MGRLLHFEVIADDRFGQTEDDAIAMAEQIRRDLLALPSVKVTTGRVRALWFGEPENNWQWRIGFWIAKTRAVTWNEVMRTVNRTKAPYYRYV